VRLEEKGSNQHEMPCHHNLDDNLHAYIDGAGQGIAAKGLLFRTAIPHTEQLTDPCEGEADVYGMIGRRALTAGIGPGSDATVFEPQASPST
jgi:hypothetical protein